MKSTIARTASLAILLAAADSGAQADLRAWQLGKIFAPTAVDLAAESGGRVFIYDGLRDTDIERAMQDQFGRIGAMMFVRTLVTEGSGAPLRDETGAFVTEDDDCD